MSHRHSHFHPHPQHPPPQSASDRGQEGVVFSWSRRGGQPCTCSNSFSLAVSIYIYLFVYFFLPIHCIKWMFWRCNTQTGTKLAAQYDYLFISAIIKGWKSLDTLVVLDMFLIRLAILSFEVFLYYSWYWYPSLVSLFLLTTLLRKK